MSVALTLSSNRYQVHDIIGSGAMGSVYRCSDRLSGQTVALKAVNLERASGQRGVVLRTAITREFETLASLHHPHVVEVIDYGFDANEQPYFTMPYIDHAAPIDVASRTLSTNERIHLIIQTLEALEYLHRRGIIHHDLKPSNVLVDSDNKVKVLDFGIALLRQRQAKEPTGSTIGYTAPELLQGSRANEISDVCRWCPRL